MDCVCLFVSVFGLVMVYYYWTLKWIELFFGVKVTTVIAFNALMLLVGQQEGIQPVKNWVVGHWHGYLSSARCIFAYCRADATVTHFVLLQ